MRATAIALIRAYRRWLSPILGPSCRFYPTCSEYAVACFRHYSLPRAGIKVLGRLLRCHPWHPGGVDHPWEPYA